MTEAAFDEIIHPAHRLQICAMLATVDSMAFATVRASLNVSDSVLSKQLKVLQYAGYLTITKTPRHADSRTWLTLTTHGRQALSGHLAALRRIADQTRQEPPSNEDTPSNRAQDERPLPQQ